MVSELKGCPKIGCLLLLAGASAIAYVGIKVISADSAQSCQCLNLAKVSRSTVPTPSFACIHNGRDRFVHETGFEFQAFDYECYALFCNDRTSSIHTIGQKSGQVKPD